MVNDIEEFLKDSLEQIEKGLEKVFI